MKRVLRVYLYHHYVGDLMQNRGGAMTFRYASTWLETPDAIALSQSLPLQETPFSQAMCRGFFSGLLPEDEKRKHIARILGISARNDFMLLEAIGGECAGAVSFLPADWPQLPTKSEYRPVSDNELAEILNILPNRPLLAGEDGVRLSLAGAQDKLAVFFDVATNQISIPLGQSPSTHILKPPNPRFPGLVENEWTCLTLAQGIGLHAALPWKHSVAGIDCLLVKRYDRIGNDGTVERIHQEDFCQALAIASEKKYQSEGGPSLKQCFELLRRVSSQPVIDLMSLLDAVIFNYLIGNHDAHAKNFSLLYRDHHTKLAPLYDLVCTVYYPELSSKMAMKIGDAYSSKEIRLRDFEELAKDIGFTPSRVCERVADIAESIITYAKPHSRSKRVASQVLQLIGERCRKALDIFG